MVLPLKSVRPAVLKKRRHVKIVGKSGSGKTYFMRWAIRRQAMREDCGLACFFPHPQAGLELLLDLRDAGQLERVVVDDLRDQALVLPKHYLRVSRHHDPFARSAANEEYRDAFLGMPMRRRPNMETLANTPAIEKYSHVACRVYQALGEWLPLSLLPKILVRDHPVQRWAAQHCTDAEALAELAAVAGMGTHDWVTLVMPAVRFLEGFLLREHIRLRTSAPATFDLPAHLKDCGDGRPGIYVSLGGGSKESITLNMASDFQGIAFDAKANPSETVREAWTDELTTYGLFHAFEAESVATLRAFNVFRRDALQSYNYATPEIEDAHRQNTDSVIFCQGSERMARECVGDLLGMLGEYHVHHQDRTTKQRTTHRLETRKSVGKWEGPDGKGGTSETESVFLVPEVQEYAEVRDVYQSSAEQLFWNAQRLTELPVGTCWVREGDLKPHPFRVPRLSRYFPEEFDAEVDACLSRIKRRPIYVRPQAFTLPAPAPVVAPARPRPATPPKPRGGKRGMSK